MDTIGFDDFLKVELRVGRVTHAEVFAQGAQQHVLRMGLGRAGFHAVVDGQVGDGLGRVEPQERPRVQLGRERHPQGMVQRSDDGVHTALRGWRPRRPPPASRISCPPRAPP